MHSRIIKPWLCPSVPMREEQSQPGQVLSTCNAIFCRSNLMKSSQSRYVSYSVLYKINSNLDSVIKTRGLIIKSCVISHLLYSALLEEGNH